jgi:hypothetical protein
MLVVLVVLVEKKDRDRSQQQRHQLLHIQAASNARRTSRPGREKGP